MVIVESVAWEENVSMGSMAVGPRGYFEAAVVSLYSIAETNPLASLRLVTNVVVPADIKEILDSIKCEVVNQPFDSFHFAQDVPWHLAYYKFCALDCVMNNEHPNSILLLDTDTWVRSSLDVLNDDCPKNGVTLYDMHAPLHDPDRETMNEELSALLGVSAPYAHFWGGECIFGKQRGMEQLLEGCASVKRRMEGSGHYSKRGDEFLLFAADGLRLLPETRAANAYVRRCWTGRDYSVPTWADAIILHLPREKIYGFPLGFKRLARGHSIDDTWFCRTCGLRKPTRPFDPKWILTRGLNKLKGSEISFS